MIRILLTSLICTATCFGAYESWTSKDGRTAQLELIKTIGEGDDLSGLFRMKSGKTVTIKSDALNEDSARKLAEPKAAADTHNAPKSVFDDILKGNLLKVTGDTLVKSDNPAKPTKYYLFYYTAEWCAPCHRFTPTLVKLYNKLKPANSNFEVVVISWDQNKEGMTKYAKEAKMPWPLLELAEVEKFQQKFNHGVTGIPSVVICDLEGKVVAKTQDLAEIKKLIK